MPILFSFLAAEKLIVEEQTKKITIVNVLHDVYVPVIRSVQIPPNTLAPLSWCAFTMWYHNPEDPENTWWEQVVILEGENGERLLSSEPQRFQMAHHIMRVSWNFNQIPVYREAQCKLTVYIRDLGLTPGVSAASRWESIMSYPISLHHTYYPA